MKSYRVTGIFTIETEAKTNLEAEQKAQRILKSDGIQYCVMNAEEVLDEARQGQA